MNGGNSGKGKKFIYSLIMLGDKLINYIKRSGNVGIYF